MKLNELLEILGEVDINVYVLDEIHGEQFFQGKACELKDGLSHIYYVLNGGVYPSNDGKYLIIEVEE